MLLMIDFVSADLVTVAILAQGTIRAAAAEQAFLQFAWYLAARRS